MPLVCCEDCGLYFQDGNVPKCYKTKRVLETLVQENCDYFTTLQYDGDSPYTPAQQLFLYEDSKDGKKMKFIQGLRF